MSTNNLLGDAVNWNHNQNTRKFLSRDTIDYVMMTRAVLRVITCRH